jgi:hypothetical protein
MIYFRKRLKDPTYIYMSSSVVLIWTLHYITLHGFTYQ